MPWTAVLRATLSACILAAVPSHNKVPWHWPHTPVTKELRVRHVTEMVYIGDKPQPFRAESSLDLSTVTKISEV